MDFDFKTATPEQLRARYNDIATEMRETQFLQKELDHVPHILQDGEQVLAFATGLMNNDTWLITLTDRRIIFLDKGMVYGLRQAVIDLDKVSSVSFTTRWLFGDIHIRDSSGTYQITNVWKKSIVPFTNRVQQAVDARKPANNPMPVYLVPPPLPDSDAASDAPLALAPPAAPPPPRRTSSRLRKWLARPAPTTRSPLPPGYPKQHTRPRLRLTRDAGKSGFSGTQR